MTARPRSPIPLDARLLEYGVSVGCARFSGAVSDAGEAH